jgi:hypothetical protein
MEDLQVHCFRQQQVRLIDHHKKVQIAEHYHLR